MARLVWFVRLCVAGAVAGPHLFGAGAFSDRALETTLLQNRLFNARLLDAMQLTPAQSRDLLRVVENAERVAAAYSTKGRELAHKQRDIYESFLEAALRDKGFTPEQEDAAHGIDVKGKALRVEFIEQIRAVAKDAETILSSQQRRTLERLREEGRTKGRKSMRRGEGETELDQLAGSAKQELLAVQMATIGQMEPLEKLLVGPGTGAALRARLKRSRRRVVPTDDIASIPYVSPFGRLFPYHHPVILLLRDIQVVNLLNGLYLTREQMRDLLAVHSRIRHPAWVQSTDITFGTAEGRAYHKALQKVVRDLERSGRADQRQYGLVARARTRALAAEMPPGGQPVVQSAVQSVCARLTPAQQQVVIAFQPCIVPPPDLKDPVRAGQAEDTTRLESTLERIRAVPPRNWTRVKTAMVRNQLRNAEKDGPPMSESRRREFVEKLVSLWERAREMDTLDFELSRKDLAGQLLQLNRTIALKTEVRDAAGHDVMLRTNVRRYLLDPRVKAHLRRRLGGK